MEIVVTGRNSEITESFRTHVAEKFERINKFDESQRIHRVDVEVTHAKNPRQRETAATVEVTLFSRGPVIRVESASADQHSALDAVMDKLEERLRRVVDRQRRHKAKHAPSTLEEATSGLTIAGSQTAEAAEESQITKISSIEVEGDGPLIVREKTHQSQAMTLDQALYEMELVGHDFFLFVEKDSMLPSVVYRRKGYDYGVIHLEITE